MPHDVRDAHCVFLSLVCNVLLYRLSGEWAVILRSVVEIEFTGGRCAQSPKVCS
jgi:hypothetical protein